MQYTRSFDLILHSHIIVTFTLLIAIINGIMDDLIINETTTFNFTRCYYFNIINFKYKINNYYRQKSLWRSGKRTGLRIQGSWVRPPPGTLARIFPRFYR